MRLCSIHSVKSRPKRRNTCRVMGLSIRDSSLNTTLVWRIETAFGRGLPLSRDIKFDRIIPTPGLIAPRHRYSMGG